MPANTASSFARLLALVVTLVALVFGAGVAQAYQPPPIRNHVTDTAGVLSSAQVRELDVELTRVRREHRFDVAVLIVPSLADEPIEDIAYDTFNTWKVGDEGLDNGVLLVLAVAEQRVRIETGKGVGGELTDIESGHIIRDQIKPQVVAGRWYEAVSVGTRAITEGLTGAASPRGPPVEPPEPELTLIQTILLAVGGLVVIVLAIVFPGFRRFLFWFVLIFFRSGRGGGSSGGGSSIGGSGGGGRSGGGGASG